METLLSTSAPKDVRKTPFPHLIREQCLSAAYYAELDRTFIDYFEVADGLGGRNNHAFNIPGIVTLQSPTVAAVWKEFFDYYLSPGSFREFLGHFEEHIKATYPDLEHRLGKSLKDLVVVPRQTDRGNIPDDADVVLDCQFTFNTPVRTPSRVRAVHVDKTRRLFSGLFYMRPSWDDSEGGDLNLYRFRGPRQFIDGVAVDDRHVDKVGQVRYAANTLMMFINSPDSLHGVTERAVTPCPRRYINILAELRIPLFDLSPYRAR